MEVYVNGKEFDDMVDENGFVLNLDQVDIISGVVYLDQDYSEKNSISLLSFFKKWRKMQTMKIMTVEVPKDRFDELKSFLTILGGKIF